MRKREDTAGERGRRRRLSEASNTSGELEGRDKVVGDVGLMSQFDGLNHVSNPLVYFNTPR